MHLPYAVEFLPVRTTGSFSIPMKVKCDCCGKLFEKVYDDMEPHLCRGCQSLGREACVECEGWCCEKPNEEGRVALLDGENESLGFKRGYMAADPCRFRDEISGHCILRVRFMPTVCKEYVCEDMVKAARAKFNDGRAG